jgi:hypothetical protein
METLKENKTNHFEKSKYMNDGMMHNRISIMKIWDVTVDIRNKQAKTPGGVYILGREG